VNEYSNDECIIELRDIIMRALLKRDVSTSSAEIEDFMSRGLYYPPDEDYEFLDWQAMNVLLALFEAKELLVIISDDELATYQQKQKTIYSPCTLNPSLALKLDEPERQTEA